MATQNIEITKGGWQNLITLGGLTLTQGNTYTVTVRGNGTNQVCVADSKPEETFLGHPVSQDVNFSFTYNGEDIWVKLSPNRANISTVVIS